MVHALLERTACVFWVGLALLLTPIGVLPLVWTSEYVKTLAPLDLVSYNSPYGVQSDSALLAQDLNQMYGVSNTDRPTM